jgi:hypothetical protein
MFNDSTNHHTIFKLWLMDEFFFRFIDTQRVSITPKLREVMRTVIITLSFSNVHEETSWE